MSAEIGQKFRFGLRKVFPLGADTGLLRDQLPVPLRVLAGLQGSWRLHWLASTHSWRSNFVFQAAAFENNFLFKTEHFQMRNYSAMLPMKTQCFLKFHLRRACVAVLRTLFFVGRFCGVISVGTVPRHPWLSSVHAIFQRLLHNFGQLLAPCAE